MRLRSVYGKPIECRQIVGGSYWSLERHHALALAKRWGATGLDLLYSGDDVTQATLTYSNKKEQS